MYMDRQCCHYTEWQYQFSWCMCFHVKMHIIIPISVWQGAVNLHTEAQIQKAFHHGLTVGQSSSPPAEGQQGPCWPQTRPEPPSPLQGRSPRKLLIFHCELSTERGPRLWEHQFILLMRAAPEIHSLSFTYAYVLCLAFWNMDRLWQNICFYPVI